MSLSILTTAIRYEHDVVTVRQRARQIAELLGFESAEQTRIATAVSEIARNAYRYGGGGIAEFLVEETSSPQVFTIHITDKGVGIGDIQSILDGRYRSSSGMGNGIIGARRLMDRFSIESKPGLGTEVRLGKALPLRAPLVTPMEVARIAKELAEQRPSTPLDEVEATNRELLRALAELQRRQEELTRLNAELEDTNRGVVALYAELDDKAERLRRADEIKTRFLSNMSHEFRTPVNSVLGLVELLLDRTDGDLTPEQEKQVLLIRQAMRGLSELVSDLLDLSKVEAGKIEVRPAEFRVPDLFAALRGMFRPLVADQAVALVFEESEGLPPLCNDEGKVSQILRNFISNALKFTERGEVRVAARLDSVTGAVVFSVRDTGIGIAPEHHSRIFEEFTQIETPRQRKVKGTGLGLPLSKRLAELLGGSIRMESEPGVGSTFHATIPIRYGPVNETPPARPRPALDVTRFPLLVVEDSLETIGFYEETLKDSGFQLLPAQTLTEAREVLQHTRPAAIVLDLLLPDEQNPWVFLGELRSNDATRDIPVLVVSVLNEAQTGQALGANEFAVKPVDPQWLIERLGDVSARIPAEKVLVIDDEEGARYLLKATLSGTRYAVVEAADGPEGLQRARDEKPRAIFLDLIMPGMSGFEVLERLKADPATRDIPVVIATSKLLDAEERRRLLRNAEAILVKGGSREQTLAHLRDILQVAAR